MQSELERQLDKVLVSFTDKVLHFPRTSPITEFPPYMKMYKPLYPGGDTLIVACRDKSYKQIMEAVYDGLTGWPKDLFDISRNDRKILYKCYKNNEDVIKRNQKELKW